MTRRLLHACALAIGCGMTGLASAQSPPPDDADLAELAAYQAKIERLRDELAREMKKIEDEQRATLRELGETDEELARERKRADELQREIDRLTGRAPASAEGAAEGETAGEPEAPHSRVMLAIPERRVNALGVLDATRTDLVPAPEGATSLRLLPLGEVPAGVIVIQRERGIAFEHRSSLDTATPLAELRLHGGMLQWAWQAPSPHALEAPLAALDRLLATAEIQALAGSDVVATFQVEPAEHRLSLRERNIELRLPQLTGLLLAVERNGEPAGWVINQDAPGSLRAVSRNLDTRIEWRSDAGLLVVRTGPGLTAAQAQAEREVAGWEKDLAGLQAAPSRDEGEIGRVTAELEAARTRRQWVVESLGDIDREIGELRVELTAANGVVCARLNLVVE